MVVGMDDNLKDDDIVVVVQGDEPLVHPEMIDLAVQPLLEDNSVYVSNLVNEISDGEWQDPGEIKVVCDLNMNAMYMSRSPIPSIDHEDPLALEPVWIRFSLKGANEAIAKLVKNVRLPPT